MGYTAMFFHQFYRERQLLILLFASLADTAFPNWGLLLKERICSKRSKFFSLRVNPSREKGSKYVNDSYFPWNTHLKSEVQLLYIALCGLQLSEFRHKYKFCENLQTGETPCSVDFLFQVLNLVLVPDELPS